MKKILFASSEIHPLMKTGGLADVAASLPIALHEMGQDIRLIMPAYPKALLALEQIEKVASIKLAGFHWPIEILQSTLPGTDIVLWLLNSPTHFNREGSPYTATDGDEWPDNAARFALFSRAVVAIAMNQTGFNWQPDIVHCNDWQTGLVPALLSSEVNRPATVFTVHNLAYQGVYSQEAFEMLDLPQRLWSSVSGIEFYGQMSFMKGGLVFADQITTVSPTYATEIQTAEFGCGLEGLLAHRVDDLTGILNGIDMAEWDPAHDPHIARHYTAKTVRLKAESKTAIQRKFGLPEKADIPLFGLVSRLVSQKGIDLILAAMTALLAKDEDIQLVCLGSGDTEAEQALRVLRARYPDKVGVEIGYNEPLAHQIEAGIDLFLMPSRFEPCGLNQLYSLRYGSLPIVRNTGGLADSVVDATDANRQAEIATGFKFEESTAEALTACIARALDLFKRPRLWRKVVVTAMAQDFSWEKSAKQYLQLYRGL